MYEYSIYVHKCQPVAVGGLAGTHLHTHSENKHAHFHSHTQYRAHTFRHKVKIAVVIVVLNFLAAARDVVLSTFELTSLDLVLCLAGEAVQFCHWYYSVVISGWNYNEPMAAET